jgi:iron complex outermembrane receptor protein
MKNHLALLCGCLTVATAFADTESNQFENLTLEPFVVTATRYPEESAKVAAFITVLTQQDIQKSGARTVNEAIMRLGGIVGRPSLYGGNEYSLDMSGFGDTASSNMVFVVDGVTFKQGDASEIRLGNISLDEVERIEIQRGGSSVLFGEGAVAGVINIVTHASGLRGKVENTGKIEAGFGSYASRDVKASATYGNQGLHLFASSAKTESDGFRSNSASHAGNTSLSLQLTGDNTRLGGSYTKSDEYAQTPGSLNVSQYQSNRNQADAVNLSVGTYSKASSNHYGFFVETEFKDILWRADLKRRERNYYFLDQTSGSASSATHNTTNDSYTLTANKKWSLDSGVNRLIAGIEKNDWNQTRVTSSFGDYTNLSNTKALFIKNDMDIDRWDTRLTTGYRIEDMAKISTGTTDSYSPYSSNKTLSAWELGASKAIDSKNILWAKASTHYRLPNIDEFSTSYDSIGNYKNLNPQISTDTDIGWKYKSTDTRIDARLFQSEITNEISYDSYYQSNVNLDPTRRQGIEANVRHNMTSKLEVQAYATYRKSTFASGSYAGNKLPMAAQNIYNLRTAWNFSPEQTVSLSVSYVGEQQIAGDYSNGTTMPAYTVTDIFYKYQTRQWECQLAVRNVFNQDYYAYATDAYSSYEVASTRYTALYPDMKRNLFLNFKYYLR